MANPFAADSSPIPPGDQPLSIANGVATPQWYRYWFNTGDQAKMAAAGLSAFGRNRVHNASFVVNHRGFAGGAVGAGAFFFDRWKGGGAGCTVSAIGGTVPDRIITLSAGTMIQTIEGVANEGGTFTLSWFGTSVAKVPGASAFVASPVTFSTTTGTQYDIEFSTGTTGRVQLEPGSIATPFGWTPYTFDLIQCRRFLQILPTGTAGGTGAAGTIEYVPIPFPVQMRAVPTGTGYILPTLINCNTYTIGGLTVDGGVQFATVIAAGPWAITAGYNMWSAEI
jgi:hypothetical protein